MLLMEWWDNPDMTGDPEYISDQGIDEWDDYLIDFTGFTLRTAKPHGGGLIVEYGQFSVKANMQNSLPVDYCAFNLYYTLSDPADKVFLCTGKGSQNYFDKVKTTYDIVTPKPNVRIEGVGLPYVSPGTLFGLFQDFVDVLNLTDPTWTLNTDDAEDKTIIKTWTNPIIHFNLLSDMSADCHHWFYLDYTTKTVFLVDVMDKGTYDPAHDFDDNDFVPLGYPFPVPKTSVESGDEKWFHGEVWYGEEMVIEDHGGSGSERKVICQNILELYSTRDVPFKIPLEFYMNSPIDIGNRIRWIDTKYEPQLSCLMTVRQIRFEFPKELNKRKAVFIGDTEISEIP